MHSASAAPINYAINHPDAQNGGYMIASCVNAIIACYFFSLPLSPENKARLGDSPRSPRDAKAGRVARIPILIRRQLGSADFRFTRADAYYSARSCGCVTSVRGRIRTHCARRAASCDFTRSRRSSLTFPRREEIVCRPQRNFQP